MELEVWKDIEGYPNYQISNFGKVKSVERETYIKDRVLAHRKEKILKGYIDKKGYHLVCLYNKNQKVKTFRVHRLVAKYFIHNTENKSQVNHKDGNKLNNYFENLEWCTNYENIQHAIKKGLINQDLRKENMQKLGKSRKALMKRWGTEFLEKENSEYKVGE